MLKQPPAGPGFLLKDTLKVIYNIKNIVTNRIADNNIVSTITELSNTLKYMCLYSHVHVNLQHTTKALSMYSYVLYTVLLDNEYICIIT